jgi:hypothetical protein
MCTDIKNQKTEKLVNIRFISKLYSDSMANIQQIGRQNTCKNPAMIRWQHMQIKDAILPAKFYQHPCTCRHAPSTARMLKTHAATISNHIASDQENWYTLNNTITKI